MASAGKQTRRPALVRFFRVAVAVAFSLVALGRVPEALEFLAGKDQKVPAKIRQIIGALRALLEGRRAAGQLARLIVRD